MHSKCASSACAARQRRTAARALVAYASEGSSRKTGRAKAEGSPDGYEVGSRLELRSSGPAEKRKKRAFSMLTFAELRKEVPFQVSKEGIWRRVIGFHG